jgi:hypothetical protein
MLDRLERLEADVRKLLALEPIRAELAKQAAEHAELQAKGQDDARKAAIEQQDKVMESDAVATEAQAKKLDETDPEGAKRLRDQSKARQDAYAQKKAAAEKDREAAEAKAEASKRSAEGVPAATTQPTPPAPLPDNPPPHDESFHAFTNQEPHQPSA